MNSTVLRYCKVAAIPMLCRGTWIRFCGARAVQKRIYAGDSVQCFVGPPSGQNRDGLSHWDANTVPLRFVRYRIGTGVPNVLRTQSNP